MLVRLSSASRVLAWLCLSNIYSLFIGIEQICEHCSSICSSETILKIFTIEIMHLVKLISFSVVIPEIIGSLAETCCYAKRVSDVHTNAIKYWALNQKMHGYNVGGANVLYRVLWHQVIRRWWDAAGGGHSGSSSLWVFPESALGNYWLNNVSRFWFINRSKKFYRELMKEIYIHIIFILMAILLYY